jgi:hypothetical protein
MSSDKGAKKYSGHRPADVRQSVGEMTGHTVSDGTTKGSGHLAPKNQGPTNLAPPPKRDDAGSSAKPPK